MWTAFLYCRFLWIPSPPSPINEKVSSLRKMFHTLHSSGYYVVQKFWKLNIFEYRRDEEITTKNDRLALLSFNSVQRSFKEARANHCLIIFYLMIRWRIKGQTTIIIHLWTTLRIYVMRIFGGFFRNYFTFFIMCVYICKYLCSYYCNYFWYWVCDLSWFFMIFTIKLPIFFQNIQIAFVFNN